MSLRDALNKNKSVVAAAAVVVIGGAVMLSFWMRKGDVDPALALPDRAFFTTDDGKTTFIESSRKVAPFAHDGKTAVRARMFKAGKNGTPFVGYLERVEPSHQAKVQELQDKVNLQFGSPDLTEALDKFTEVKALGSDAWIKMATADGARVQNVKDPGGSTQPLEPVAP